MKYKLIYADPPWKFNNKNTGGSMNSGADAQYPTMTIAELKNMDIDSITDDNSLLIMWYVGSQPQEAIDLCQAWGFKVKNMNGFMWNKLTKLGKAHFGMGFYTRAGSESAIIATKGSPKIINHSVRAVESCKVGKHSEKPAKFRKKCIQLMGNVPRLEMFARKEVAGWDLFGNEAPRSIQIKNKGEIV
jgi:N6-adenosine-specific RNA methylase IME4